MIQPLSFVGQAVGVLLSCLFVGGCGTAVSSVYPKSGYVFPNTSLALTPSTTISFEQALAIGVVGTALYLVYDPLAPNWDVEEKAISEDTYTLSLRAKSFRVGGDGEAYQILKRRAVQLQRINGYSGYRILDYSEGILSSTPLTKRVSEGTIKLVHVESKSSAW